MAMTLRGYPHPARCDYADRPVDRAGDVVLAQDVATCGATSVPAGRTPIPLQQRVTIAAGTAILAAPRRHRLVRPTRRSQRGVLAATAISEWGRRDQAYGPIGCPSRVLHQDLTGQVPQHPERFAKIRP